MVPLTGWGADRRGVAPTRSAQGWSNSLCLGVGRLCAHLCQPHHIQVSKNKMENHNKCEKGWHEGRHREQPLCVCECVCVLWWRVVVVVWWTYVEFTKQGCVSSVLSPVCASNVLDTNIPLSCQLTLKGPSGYTEGVTLLLLSIRLLYSLFPFCYLHIPAISHLLPLCTSLFYYVLSISLSTFLLRDTPHLAPVCWGCSCRSVLDTP